MTIPLQPPKAFPYPVSMIMPGYFGGYSSNLKRQAGLSSGTSRPAFPEPAVPVPTTSPASHPASSSSPSEEKPLFRREQGLFFLSLQQGAIHTDDNGPDDPARFPGVPGLPAAAGHCLRASGMERAPRGRRKGARQFTGQESRIRSLRDRARARRPKGLSYTDAPPNRTRYSYRPAQRCAPST